MTERHGSAPASIFACEDSPPRPRPPPAADLHARQDQGRGACWRLTSGRSNSDRRDSASRHRLSQQTVSVPFSAITFRRNSCCLWFIGTARIWRERDNAMGFDDYRDHSVAHWFAIEWMTVAARAAPQQGGAENGRDPGDHLPGAGPDAAHCLRLLDAGLRRGFLWRRVRCPQVISSYGVSCGPSLPTYRSRNPEASCLP